MIGSVNNASNGISFGLENPKIVGSTNLTSSSNSKFTFQKRIGESQYPVQVNEFSRNVEMIENTWCLTS